MTDAVAQFAEIEQITANAVKEAMSLDNSRKQLIAASAVLSAVVEEFLGHLPLQQAGENLRDGLSIALRLMEQARSTNKLLEAAQLALAGYLSDVCMFNEQPKPTVERPSHSRAFRPQRQD